MPRPTGVLGGEDDSGAAGPRPGRWFPGWTVVVLMAAVLAIGVGVTFYGLSVYLSALTREGRGFSLTQVSVATSAFLVATGVTGLPVGRLLARYDARAVLLPGLLATALAVLAIGRVQTAWQLVLAYTLLGAGFAAISVIPASTLVARWFVRRRARAMSLVFLGLPVGGALVSPLVAVLVERLGVAGAGPWLAALLLGVAGPLSLAVRPDPGRRGLLPDGDAPSDGTTVDPATAGSSAADAFADPWFLLVGVALMLGMLSQLGALAHLYNAVSERLDTTIAATALSTAAAASVVGRLAGSWVFERVALPRATAGLMTLQAGSLVLLAVLPTHAAVVVATVAFGISMGNLQVLQPLLLADRYGARDFAAILARGNLLVTVGMALGPVTVGAVHDLAGDYTAALAACAVAAALGAVLMLRAGRLPAPAVR